MNQAATKPRTKPRTASKQARKAQLIKATIRSIAKHGLSVTTMSIVAKEAGLSQGIINLHFQSKEKLLEETLRFVVDEYHAAWFKAIENSGVSAAEKLAALAGVNFDKTVCQRNKLAVWFAFWGESRSRPTYRKICAARDREYKQVLTGLCEEIIKQGGYPVRAEFVAYGLSAMNEGLWLDLLLVPTEVTPEQARDVSLSYLRGIFPEHFPTTETAGSYITMDKQTIAALIDAQPERTALDQAFYTDADIYQRDIEQIYLKSWLYAGHLSEIPAIGDWFLFEMAGESVIIVRSGKTEVNALINVCRHRGSKICLDKRGCSKKLVCRYHGWSYNLDGQLHAAAHMQDDFDKSAIKLKKIHTEIFEGMVYINFADQAASFEPVREAMTECLRPYRLDRAKVAHRQTYAIDANWKLSVENYTECYHCAPAHPEYSRGHSLARPGSRADGLMEEVMQRADACGLSDKVVDQVYLDEPGFGTGHFFERYPMWRGHITGSDDGQPVAPLLGEIRDYDGGTTDFQIGPVTFALAYCDHVVIYRFTPVALDKSECDITWLVNGDAEEGKDYDKERLTWLWDVTTLADKRIIEYNSEGVNSRFYEPGPYSKMEEFTWQFMSWYLAAIRP